MKSRFTPLDRIYRLKLLLVGASLLILSLLASALADWLTAHAMPHNLTALASGLADVFLVTGAIGVAVNYFTGRDSQRAMSESNRAVQLELMPQTIDTVLQAFAARPEDMKRVATAEFLDQLVKSALTLRLSDEQFAREIYEDVRDQAIRAPERWHDVDVSIRLSSIDESSTAGAARFEVLVKWEYTVVPSHPIQRFACVADRSEFRELISDVPSTIPWLMTPRPGFQASSIDAFELLEYRVDGGERPIRRSSRKGGQTYSALIGEDIVRAGKPVRISYLYRTITPQSGHRLFFEVTQPTRGLSLELDYSNTDIAHMSATDLVSSAKRTQVTQMPKEVDAKIISVDLPGWLLPRAGFAFVWTLLSEAPPENEPGASGHSGSVPDAA